MIKSNHSKTKLRKAWQGWVFGCFAAILGLASLGAPLIAAPVARAEDGEVLEWGSEEAREAVAENAENAEEAEETAEEAGEAETAAGAVTSNLSASNGMCKDSLGSLGWLVCPATGKIAEAVDWLYGKIRNILELNPVEMKDGAPIYEVWKYLQAVANIVFVIFLLIVVYSQLTGLGISNYGIKKALPKLIVVAILVNLSFVICSLMVDLSNVIGNGLRGAFDSIEMAAMSTTTSSAVVEDEYLMMSQMYGSMASGAVLAVGGGVIAFETGAIWMLIPVALGALVAVVAGLITIALRQAVVVILIMVAPLAIVANMLPNTEQWFKKWWKLMTRMLVFYPAFSLLFGASSLAGYAIIASATDGFGMMLGVAVQIFPLFFSWSLMKMSGTFLETINTRIRAIGNRPVSGVRSWADERREAQRLKYLASENAYTPSLRLRQYLSNRKVKRASDMEEDAKLIKARGQVYTAQRRYVGGNLDGKLSREGREDYNKQARGMEYEQRILRDQNNFNKGFGYREEKGTAAWARINELDVRNVKGADNLKWEQARTEKIAYDNAVGFHNRSEAAINAHMDAQNGYIYQRDENGNFMLDNDGNKVIAGTRSDYKLHTKVGSAAQMEAAARYGEMSGIMEGDALSTQYAAAAAAANYDTQAKIIMTKFQKYFELTPPTQDVMYRIQELSRYQKALEQYERAHGNLSGISSENRLRAVDNIDAIISGLRIVTQRGDTDLVQSVIDDLLDEKYGGLELGTHASQAIAGLLMFDVGDADPALKRFGKYINLETARMFNKNERKERKVTFEEYVKGYHMEPDPETGEMKPFYAKKPMVKLLEGTSFDNIERTAMDNLDDRIKKVYGYDPDNKDKDWDREGWLKKLKETMTAIEPQFLSANQKYLSGSEAMGSFVKFWSGYAVKPRKDPDTGEFVLDEKGEQIFDNTPIWEGKEFAGFEDRLEEFYQKNMYDFYKDQTTAQVLNSRTDWRGPTVEHLLKMYLEDSKVGKEELAKRNREYAKEKLDIINKYKDDNSAEAAAKRAKELDDLKKDFAARQLRKILGESGKLKQIYRTRTGGTAINSKDWLRGMVLLDDEDLLRNEVAYYDDLRQRNREEANKHGGADSAADDDSARIYDNAFKEECLAELHAIWDEMRDDSPLVFYEATMDKIHGWFGKDTSLVEYKYKQYYKDNERTLATQDLSLYLRELLEDLSNYPDQTSL